MAKSLVPSTDVAPSSLALFGAPPLLESEDPAAYDELLARVSGAVKPADVLEEIWVRDVVDLVWETIRLRRLKTNLLAANLHRGLEDILTRLYDYVRARELAGDWAKREQYAIDQVNDLFAKAGLTMDSVISQTLSVQIKNIERIEYMIMNAEARRNSALREIDRHRASFGQALRRAGSDVAEAQFVETKPPKSRNRNVA